MLDGYTKYHVADESPSEEAVNFNAKHNQHDELLDPHLEFKIKRKKLRIKSDNLDDQLVRKIESRLAKVTPKEKNPDASYHMSFKI